MKRSMAAPIVAGLGAFALSALFADAAFAQEAAQGVREYGNFPVIGSRAAVWVAAQVHLMFAAFVLGVPMFAVAVEAIGIFTKDEKYDKLAKEFVRLLLIAYSATAIWGAVLTMFLVTLYPRFWSHLSEIFEVSIWVIVGIALVIGVLAAPFTRRAEARALTERYATGGGKPTD